MAVEDTRNHRMIEDFLGGDALVNALCGAWTLDPARSEIAFSTRALWGARRVKGRFRNFAATGEISADGAVHGQLEVASASIDTKLWPRDWHLRSRSFLAVAQFPMITFDLLAVSMDQEGPSARGRLTIRDKSEDVAIKLEVLPLDDGAVSVRSNARIDRSKFGMNWRWLGARDMISVVTVEAVFVRT